ncbi:MAG: glycosyltransferase N-terminal domain-containing protein [Bacteroidota bacterium]|nr:glycosyltransferase N-terminal domain-containing protein [Bacteroidota bacterium]
MFRTFYNFAIILYGFGITIASLFNDKAKLWKNGRKGQWAVIESGFLHKDHVVWFHCASLGEFEQGRPVIEEYKKRNPECSVLLTFFSPSGYEVRKNYEHAEKVFYLPLDTRKNVRQFLELVQPKLVVFVKYEFWYNYLHELHLKGIPVFLISANFREDQWFFKFSGKAFMKMLSFFTHLFVQNERSAMILKKHGILNCTVSGDTRFDRVDQIQRQSKKLKIIEEFKNDQTLIVAGSTWREDEEILIKYINEQKPGLKWILAPHEIDETHIQFIFNRLSRPGIRYSECNHAEIKNFDILVIDNIGLLSSLYGYGEIAYVGGGFGAGIHNVLEPAGYGIPIIFGPAYRKFQEAIDLVELGGGISIKSYEDFVNRVTALLGSSESLINTGVISGDYVQNNKGATQAIVHNLLKD